MLCPRFRVMGTNDVEASQVCHFVSGHIPSFSNQGMPFTHSQCRLRHSHVSGTSRRCGYPAHPKDDLTPSFVSELSYFLNHIIKFCRDFQKLICTRDTRWSLGSALFLASWAAMMGPWAYATHLVSTPRLPFTAAYFGSIALTLYFSLGVRVLLPITHIA
jgi:hypothetical protein